MEHQAQQIDLAKGSRLLVINLPVAVSFSFDIYVRSGTRFCPLKQYELSHLLEHLSFEGNELYPDPLAFKVEVERDGTYFNAHTNMFYNYYRFISLPGELSRIIQLGLAQVFRPILTDKAIAHEKETVANELIGHEEDFSSIRGYLASQVILGKRLPDYSDRIKGLKMITSEQLRQYHAANYHPSNMRFVLSGHFSQSEIDRAVELINLSLEEQSEAKANDYTALPLLDFGRKVVTRKIPIKNQVLFSFQMTRPGLDLDALSALWVLQAIYSGGFSSRMMIKGRQQGLTYTFQSAVGTDLDQSDFEFWDQTEPGKLKQLLELSITELAALAHGDFTDEELERAIGYEVGTLRRGYQTPAGYAGWYGGDFIYGRELYSPEQRIQELLAVDRAAITKVTKRYLTKDNWALVVLGQTPDELVEGFSEMVDKAFG